jgi:flagellar hook-associated protein 3 FlgL
MRVSENMMTNSILKSINASKSRMSNIQKQLSSGKKIFESSDDPFAFAKSARFKSIMERNNQYLRVLIWVWDLLNLHKCT